MKNGLYWNWKENVIETPPSLWLLWCYSPEPSRQRSMKLLPPKNRCKQQPRPQGRAAWELLAGGGTYRGPASGPLRGRKEKDAWETPPPLWALHIYYSFTQCANGWQTTRNVHPTPPGDTKPMPAPLASCCLLGFSPAAKLRHTNLIVYSQSRKRASANWAVNIPEGPGGHAVCSGPQWPSQLSSAGKASTYPRGWAPGSGWVPSC